MNINRSMKITRSLQSKTKEIFTREKECQVIRELHIYFVYANTFLHLARIQLRVVLIEFSAH